MANSGQVWRFMTKLVTQDEQRSYQFYDDILYWLDFQREWKQVEFCIDCSGGEVNVDTWDC